MYVLPGAHKGTMYRIMLRPLELKIVATFNFRIKGGECNSGGRVEPGDKAIQNHIHLILSICLHEWQFQHSKITKASFSQTL